MEDLSRINVRRMEIAAALGEPDQVPISLIIDANWLSKAYGVRERALYVCPDRLLDLQLRARKRFRGLVSVKPDLGIVIEPSALGCRIVWPEDGPPWVVPSIRTPEDVDRLKVPDPLRDGLMGKCLEIYECMKDRVKELGLNFKVSPPMSAKGPFTVAGLSAGIERMMAWVRNSPDVADKLVKKCAETQVAWAQAQLDAAGEKTPLFVGDDYSGFISPNNFKRFTLPYLREFFSRFKHPLNIYHNDAPTNHLLDLVGELGAPIFHLGPSDMVSLKEAKRRLGGKLCLMGGVHPTKTMLTGTAAYVERECAESIAIAGVGGGFILAPAGTTSKGIPPENIDAIINAAEKYGRYPITP